MRIKSEVVKRSISLSKVVADWADELAHQKGHGANFSAYLADLIRRDKERENDLKMMMNQPAKAGALSLAEASDQLVDEVEKVAQHSPRRKKQS